MKTVLLKDDGTILIIDIQKNDLYTAIEKQINADFLDCYEIDLNIPNKVVMFVDDCGKIKSNNTWNVLASFLYQYNRSYYTDIVGNVVLCESIEDNKKNDIEYTDISENTLAELCRLFGEIRDIIIKRHGTDIILKELDNDN